LEIHAELKTNSKMYCACQNAPFSLEKNTATCPVCLAHPGTLPRLNSAALDLGIMAGLALNCSINQKTKFDRKNYFYPDLPKGYQISQYDLPVAFDGYVELAEAKIGVERAHLEEDTAKLIHLSSGDTEIDYNRAGVPLLEIVSKPNISNASQAKEYAKAIQRTLRYIGASDADMEKGAFRCEANVSIQEKGKFEIVDNKVEGDNLNNKVEVKNINSFRSLERAIDFEIKRQTELVLKGQTVLPETRGVDDKTGETFSQRIKETAADYRYFSEPDLPALFISDEMIAEIKNHLPELPTNKLKRFKEEYSLPDNLALQIIEKPTTAAWFEKAVSELGAWVESLGDDLDRQDKSLANTLAKYLTGEVFKLLNEHKIELLDSKISPNSLAGLVVLSHKGQINSSGAQSVLTEMFKTGKGAQELINEMGLEIISEESLISELAEKVISENYSQAADYRKGKTNLIQFFIGKLMAASGGRANPVIAKEELEKILNT